MTVYDKLRDARNMLGLSQSEAAIKANLKQKDLSLLEGGNKKFIPEEYILFLYNEGIDINSVYDMSLPVTWRQYQQTIHTMMDNVAKKYDITPPVNQHLSEHNKAYITNTPTGKSALKTQIAQKHDPPTDPPKYILLPKIITVDSHERENILHVSIKAAAGYVQGHSDPEYLGNLPSFRLPGLGNASYRSFEVDGDSMEPTLKNRQMVIGEWLESLEDIREDRVHIIVLKSGKPIIKRLLNRISKRNVIIAKSDATNNRELYKNIEIDPDEVLEVWYARFHGGFDFQAPTDMWKRVNNHEADLTILQNQVDKLLEVVKTAGLLAE